MFFNESLLNGVQVVRRSQRLDRLNFMSIGLNSEDGTGTNCLTVHQNGAGPAQTMLAAHMRTGQTKIVADKVAQQKTGLNLTLILLAVHRNVNFDC